MNPAQQHSTISSDNNSPLLGALSTEEAPLTTESASVAQTTVGVRAKESAKERPDYGDGESVDLVERSDY